MREIRFRAWDNSPFLDKPEMYDNERLNQLDKDGLIHLYDIIEGTENNITLMRFTGKKDENEAGIYEDDYCIAEFKTKTGIIDIKGVISMEEFMWCLKTEDGTLYSLNRISNVLIYSNIHSNPELLNK